jgi:hypothetical protein
VITTLTDAEQDALCLYSYWDDKDPDDPNFPDDDTAREILKSQGFYD